MTNVTVTNRRRMGALSVTKTLSGNAANKVREFVFTVTLKNSLGIPVAGEYDYERKTRTGTTSPGTIAFEAKEDGSAVGTFSLEGGETVTIFNLYQGTTYTVTEQDYRASGYTTTSTGDTGTVKENETSATEFRNTRNSGSLTIRKTVVTQGMGIPTSRAFTFTVTLTLPNGAPFTGALKGVDQSGGTHNVNFVNGTATITLCHDQSLTIEDILVDCAYTVSEKAEDDVESTESSGTSGTMTTDGATASFTNTLRQEYTSLRFTKRFSRDEDYGGRPGSVTVRVSNRDNVIGTYVLDAGNDWTVQIDDLPKYDSGGNEYIYSVVEVQVPEHYKAVYTREDGTVVITNVYREDKFEEIGDFDIPLGAGMVMNEGYCFE